MKRHYDVAVVGGGIAGLSAARAAAAAGAERVLLINGEDRLPYKRTKISKNLRERYETDAFALISDDELSAVGIDLRRCRVGEVEPSGKVLQLDDGTEIGWQALVLATGARPRHLFPKHTLVVRSAHDGEIVNGVADTIRTVIVIGGGVLGIETADQLNQRGLEVKLLTRGSRLMARELTPIPSEWLAQQLRRHGITYELNALVRDVTRFPGGLEVHTESAAHTADAVIECTGSVPDTTLAESAGLVVGGGTRVDWFLGTSVPGIFAAGDGVELPDGSIPHLWHQAEDQGVAAGANAARHAAGIALEAYSNRPRRLKCEAFGEFLFSMNPQLRDRLEETVAYENAAVYQEFGFIDGALAMVMMTGDKERAKSYEKAVWDGLSPAQIRDQLSV